MEREREVDALRRPLEAARRGEGGAALVEGPAGIGKSRLLDAAAASADDFVVLRARASELEREFPFGVVATAVRVAAVRREPGGAPGLLAGAGGLAERVLAPWRRRTAAAATRSRRCTGCYWFAATLPASRPVLLLVDDARMVWTRPRSGGSASRCVGSRACRSRSWWRCGRESPAARRRCSTSWSQPSVHVIPSRRPERRWSRPVRRARARRHARCGVPNRLPAGHGREPVPRARAPA